jgi:hypothetical protein
MVFAYHSRGDSEYHFRLVLRQFEYQNYQICREMP